MAANKLTKMINAKTDGVAIEIPDSDEEIMGYRHVLHDKGLFILETGGEWGYTKIKVKRGKLPKELEGMWTTPNAAHKAIETWLAKQDLQSKTTSSEA